MDRATGRSRGTGFVCFWKKEDAERAVDQARLLNVETGSGANSVPVRDRTVNPFAAPTILTADPSSSLAASLVMHGRVLQVEFAVTREEASKLKEEAERRKEKVDKRNTYLMREGVIFPNTPAAATLPPVELEKRTESFNSRKTLLASNPSLYISKTRLSIRQLPLFCTERTLKRLAIHAVREFEAEVSRGEREGLDEDESRDLTLSAAVAKAEEKSSRGNAKPKGKKERQTPVIQAKVVRATDRVDPLTGLGKAKGYGFLEMRSHQDALRVLRWANNNPTIEALMREWFNVELGELVERTKSQLDEARLEELKETSSLEVSAPSAKKQRKGKGGATNNDDEDADDGEHPQPKKKERVESSELEIRLKRLQEKVKELTQAIEAGRNVVMKKTLIIEFSIENVQVRPSFCLASLSISSLTLPRLYRSSSAASVRSPTLLRSVPARATTRATPVEPRSDVVDPKSASTPKRPLQLRRLLRRPRRPRSARRTRRRRSVRSLGHSLARSGESGRTGRAPDLS